MTGWEKQKELARYRVQQAEESLEFRPLAYLRARRKLVRRPRNSRGIPIDPATIPLADRKRGDGSCK